MSLSASQDALSVQSNADIGQLRSTLATLGYHDLVPMAATPLVTTLVNDLLRTTESLKEAKGHLADLLEQKKIWELGNESFKCESTRLLAECNDLHKQMLVQREDFEQQLSELSLQMEHLAEENKCLRENVDSLNAQLKQQHVETVKYAWANHKVKDKHSKPPFITAVRSQTSQVVLNSSNTSCTCPTNREKYEKKKTKADADKSHGISSSTSVTSSIAANRETHEYEKLEKRLERYIQKVDARDREIKRLQELLGKNGRPTSALYKECCYKDIKTLQEDVSNLQAEKTELSLQIIEHQNKLHEAMQTAFNAKVSNTALETELQQMRQVALDIENEANSLIENYERDINKLRKQLLELEEEKQKQLDDVPCCSKNIKKLKNRSSDIAKLKDNKLDYKKHEALHQKVHKLKSQLKALEHKTGTTQTEDTLRAHGGEEEDIERLQQQQEQTIEKQTLEKELQALKALCTQYRHHYMRHVTTEKENEYLKVYIKGKEEEIKYLRQQIELRDNASCAQAEGDSNKNLTHRVQFAHNCHRGSSSCTDIVTDAESKTSSSRTSAGDADSMSVQVTLKRLTLERDLATAELKRLEQYVKEFQDRATKSEQDHTEEIFKLHEKIELLKTNLSHIENKGRYWLDVTQPCYNQIALMKEERNIMEQNCKALEKALENLSAENEQLRKLTKNTTLSLEQSESKYSMLTTKLNSEHVHLSEEMSKLMSEIDQLNAFNKDLKKQCLTFEKEAEDQAKLASQYQRTNKEYYAKLKDLEEEMSDAKACIDRLSRELENKQEEITAYTEKYHQSKRENDRLTNQLTKYMEEVKKAQDILTAKEKERSELLDYYRSLSNEQSALETNNQSLEQEAEIYKEQIEELTQQKEKYKKDNEKLKELLESLQNQVYQHQVDEEALKHEVFLAKENEKALKKKLLAQQEKCKILQEECSKLKDECQTLVNSWNSLADNIRKKVEEVALAQATELESSTQLFHQVLSDAREDLEVLMVEDGKLTKEMEHVKKENQQLRDIITKERSLRSKAEDLLRKSSANNQEILNSMTDQRFWTARRREYGSHSDGNASESP